MIRLPLVAALLCVASLTRLVGADAPAPAPATTPAPAADAAATAGWTNDQKASYLIGLNMGKRLKPFAGDLDAKLIVKAIEDALAGKPSAVSAAEEPAVMQAFQDGMQAKEAKRAESRVADNKKWLDENAKKDGITTTASGLQYQVLTKGAGKQAAMGKTVTVHYVGTMLDGTTFDSSVARGEPADFPLNPGGLIQGWLEALPMMKEGDKWKLFIPSDLAYGPQGNQGIAPNSLLIFEVELIKVGGGEPAPGGVEAVPLK